MNAVRSRPSHSNSLPSKPLNTTSDWFDLQSGRLASHPRKPLFVGVFQNPTLDYLLSTIDELNLDVVQFHGTEPTEWSRLVSIPSIKVFHVDSEIETEGGQAQALYADATRPGYHSISLLDTKVGAMSGGAGKTFDWGVGKRLIESRGEGKSRLPIILAGGLDHSNVVDCIRQVRPWAVDVSGGVETDGVKDLVKIKSFIKLVKSVSQY